METVSIGITKNTNYQTFLSTEQAIETLPAESQGTSAAEIPVAMRAAMSDPYQKASNKAAEEETDREDPAMSKVASREDQAAQRDRERGGSDMTYGIERWTQQLAGTLGNLGIRFA